jgi:hypothetical protein
VRPEAALEPDRIGTQVLPGVGIVVAPVVVVQPAFRVFPLVLEAQLDLDVGIVGGSPVALRQAAGQAGVAILDCPAVEPAPGTQLAGPDDLAIVADEFPRGAERVGDDVQPGGAGLLALVSQGQGHESAGFVMPFAGFGGGGRRRVGGAVGDCKT